MSKQDCRVLVKKMGEVQAEVMDYLEFPDDQRDRNYLNDAMLLRVAISSLVVFAEEVLNRGRK